MSLFERFNRRASELRSKPMGEDLRAIRSALHAVGDPQDTVPCVLIAGTNGKGSTAAMVESIARAAGYRTGLFHSPAMGPAHEHVHIDGREIEHGVFAERFLRADDAGDLTWFEAVTAAAFLSFAEERVDIAVVEVGMGGTRDCTNVISSPLISAITTVELDHQSHLGTDLKAIAREKSGVFRPGRVAFLGWTAPEVEETIGREARRIGAELVLCSSVELSSSLLTPGHQRLQMRFPDARPKLSADLPLAGEHQARNAVMAVLIADELATDLLPKIDRQATTRGLGQCRWPGRLEWINSDGPHMVLLDAAHNPAAISTLVAYLDSNSLSPVNLLFAAFQDKDAVSMLRRLLPSVDRAWLTSTGHPRSIPAQQLAETWCRLEPKLVPTIVPMLPAALEQAIHTATAPLCITGSADLVGRARELLIRR